MTLLQATGPILANLSEHGRNLLTRSSIGQVVFTLSGFSTGRGGYQVADPNLALIITANSSKASGTVQLLRNNMASFASISINGVSFTVDTTSSGLQDWDLGPDLASSTVNLKEAINNSSDLSIHNVVTASINSGDNTIIDIVSDFVGSSANTIALETSFFSDFSFNGNPGSSPENLSGGLDESQLDKVFPTTVAPTTGTDDIEPIDDIESPTQSTQSLVCKIQQEESNYCLGEWGIWVRVRKSNISDEVDRHILYARVHQPVSCKTSDNLTVARIIIAY